jgi:hypothetical protein
MFCFLYRLASLTNRIIPIINLRFLLLIRINEQEELARYKGTDAVIDSEGDRLSKSVKGPIARVQFHITQFDCYEANIITIVGVIV